MRYDIYIYVIRRLKVKAAFVKAIFDLIARVHLASFVIMLPT